MSEATRTLFDVAVDRPSKRRMLTAFKKLYRIETHHASHLAREDHPWLAIILCVDDRGKSIGEAMAESCRLYEESGYCATGTGELSAIRKLCKQRRIPCDL